MVCLPYLVAPSGVPQPGARVTVAKKQRFRKASKLAVIATRRTWRRALRHRSAAAVEYRDVPFGHDLRTVIDVGAHHGQFALLVRERYPEADILCVEPLPNAVSRLQKVFRSDRAVRVAPVAVASTPGKRTMHVSRKTDSSSLLPILQRNVDAFPGTEQATTTEVVVSTLDDLLPSPVARPCLLKIDAQGGELEVLAGATETLNQVDMAFVECSFVELYKGQALVGEVIAEFFCHGLRLDGVYSVVQDANSRCLQADLLFRRSG